MKPTAAAKYQDVNSAELALYDTGKRYLDELKASGTEISPKKWRAEAVSLSFQKDERYRKIRAMREDIKAV